MSEKEAKCNFLGCVAGMGVAGHGQCFLGGDQLNESCAQFQPEPTDEEIEAMMGQEIVTLKSELETVKKERDEAVRLLEKLERYFINGIFSKKKTGDVYTDSLLSNAKYYHKKVTDFLSSLSKEKEG